MHPTRRQIFAGKPYSTFPTSENESYGVFVLLNTYFLRGVMDSVGTSSGRFLGQEAEALEVFPHENPLGVVHKLPNCVSQRQ